MRNKNECLPDFGIIRISMFALILVFHNIYGSFIQLPAANSNRH